MDTLEFFRAVLPSQGNLVLAEFPPGKKPRHHFFESHEAAAKAAVGMDQQGKTIYHACAAYRTTKNRKAENAGWMRAFWVDADVDPTNPEKYATQKEAAVDIFRVCKELDLPPPLIVKSGMGLHIYWILDDDITAEEWQPTAHLLKSALDTVKFRQDRTRTADMASILRPVGTQWKKAGIRPVVGVAQGSPLSHSDFLSRLRNFTGITGTPSVKHQGVGINNDDLSGGLSHAPSSALKIIQFCKTLAHVAEQRGNVQEPLWRGMLGLVRHTVEGEELCHEWSKGHPQYNEAETAEKIARWTAGPTTCAHFRGTNGHHCNGCTRNVTSPISLGYVEDGGSPPVPPSTELGAIEDEGDPIMRFWPRNFHWNGQNLCCARRDEDGMVHWIPFSRTKFWVDYRLRDENKDWFANIKYEDLGKNVGDFLLDNSLIGAQYGLAQELSKKEIFLDGEKGAKMAKSFISSMIQNMQAANVHYYTYDRMGWVDNDAGFVIGNKRFSSAEIGTVVPGTAIKAAEWGLDLGSKHGDIKEWTRIVDKVYNRPHAEALQFCILAALASPLIGLAELESFYGIPIAVTGAPGQGKTTICKVAASIYGAPSHFTLVSNREQTTMNTIITKLGISRHLPLVFDEITNRDASEVGALLYCLSQGQPKGRLNADGTLAKIGARWRTMTYLTSNRSIIELLHSLQEAHVTEATQVRVFEIVLEDGLVAKLWPDINGTDIIEQQLFTHSGEVAKVWLPYLVSKRKEIIKQLKEQRAKYVVRTADDSKERYFRDVRTFAAIAGVHAKALGIINFDIGAILKFIDHTILGMRARRSAHTFTPEDLIADFLGSLHGGIIVTKQFRDGRTTQEAPLEILRKPVMARQALEDRVFLVHRKALADWCTDNKVQLSWMEHEMDRLNIIKRNASGLTRKERIAKGVNIVSHPAVCYELNYDYVVANSLAPAVAVPSGEDLVGEAV